VVEEGAEAAAIERLVIMTSAFPASPVVHPLPSLPRKRERAFT
jgi:hypothetical protein